MADDTGERRRRGDAKGPAARKVEEAVESVWAKALARYVLPGLMIWLGSQVWGDIKEQGKSINDIRVSLGSITSDIGSNRWRIEQLENWRSRSEH